MTDDPNDIIYSPYAAMMAERTPEQQKAFLERFTAAPEYVREFFTSMDTVESVKTMMESGELSGDFDLAVTKIIAFAAIGDVSPVNIEELLIKLGISQQQATSYSQKILSVLEPVLTTRARLAMPEVPEIPPLTQKIPEQVPSPSVTQSQSKNVVDLRKQQPAQ